MRGLDQALQLAGRDERDVLVAATIDDHDVPACLDLFKQAGEVLTDVGVGGLTRQANALYGYVQYYCTCNRMPCLVKRTVEEPPPRASRRKAPVPIGEHGLELL